MSVQLKKVSADGKQVGTVDVDDSIFGLEPNTHVMYLALRRELANARAGTANTKTRAEVRGGGKKPWKQKGTGRARAGSIRSPLWKKGGVTFGPKPRDFSICLPKKVRVLALKSSLSNQSEQIVVVEDFSFLKAPKTRDMVGFLDSINTSGKKVLVVADYKAPENKNILLSARNIKDLKVSLPHNLSVKDLTHADVVIMTQSAIDQITGCYANKMVSVVETVESSKSTEQPKASRKKAA